MKTSAFIVEVVDSDFAILMLYGEKADEVIVGDGSGYGIDDASKGNRTCWEHLLAEWKTADDRTLHDLENSEEIPQ